MTRKRIYIVLVGLALTVPAQPQVASTVTLASVEARTDGDQEFAQGAAQQRKEEADQRAEQGKEHAQQQIDRQEELYQNGIEALEDHQWQAALQKFDAVIREKGARTDGALYWKAYAQNKLGQRTQAQATVSELRKSYPRSRWLDDAKALELEIQQGTGQKPSVENDANEDLKLMAINSLMSSDPEQALYMLEKFLQSSQPLKLKERALFVLSQSSSPKAREIVGGVARGQSNPDLQMKALEYLALFGNGESRQTLASIYSSTGDVSVKRNILHSFMLVGARDRLLTIASTEKNQDLRIEAVQQLGILSAQSELEQLYQSEPSTEVRKQIIHALFIGGNAGKLTAIARTDRDPELRREAVNSLGLIGADRAGSSLLTIYNSNKDNQVRAEVLNALFIQGNAKTLFEIARHEPDPSLKRQAVEKLSLMHSKDATDLMMEILKR